MNLKTNIKLKGQTALAYMFIPLCHLLPKIGRSVSGGLEHLGIADFELCEVRSYLNHVFREDGWWYVFVYLSVCFVLWDSEPQQKWAGLSSKEWGELSPG